jgi:GT2 family glycosyltransferase
VALELGGYREFLIHQGEERDLCIRLREAGWRIVYGDGGFVVHMVSPKRDVDRISYYGIRNQILFESLNAPLSHLPARLIWSSIASLSYRFTWNSLPLRLRAIWAGFADSLRHAGSRRAVSISTYRQTRLLPRHGPEEWDGPIPPPCIRDASDRPFVGLMAGYDR